MSDARMYQAALEQYYAERDDLAKTHLGEWACFQADQLPLFAGTKEKIYELLKGNGGSTEHVVVRRLTGDWVDDAPLPMSFMQQ